MGDDYIYSDTDSIKLVNAEKHKKYFDKYDTMLLRKQENMLNYYNIDPSLLKPKTIEGIEKPIGVWDYEGTYSRFKTLGAKRYMQEENGKLRITVAGLSKANGLSYMIETSKHDNTEVFNMFTNQLFIPKDKTGKNTHTYIDEPKDILITDYLGNDFEFTVESSVHLEPTEFTLSIGKQYSTFLKNFIDGFIYGGLKYV